MSSADILRNGSGNYDTLIIGAGMSGLAAGIRLAYFNRKVCILERHTTIGGLNSFYRMGGRNYDVGLHAVTNFTPKGTKRGPLARLLRQLRMAWEDLALVPQFGSRIDFPGVSLNFNNDFERFESEIERAFPAQIDNFRKLVGQVIDYDDLQPGHADISARELIGSYISDPLLVEMIFCPLMYYGSARENDMDFGQFCIMFRSIFMEGLARPWAGVRIILKKLVRRFRELGGELRLRSGVEKLVVKEGKVREVVLDGGERLEAGNILSSAGWLETVRMCDNAPKIDAGQPGQLSFIECVSTLDCQPKAFGHEHTIIFFNDSEKFHYRKPQDPVDLRSGVICSPNNFVYDEPLSEGIMRLTNLANFDCWKNLSEEEYRLAKLRWYDRAVAAAVRFVPDYRSRVVATDMFTPTTIRRFTGHDNGAVYGVPRKRFDGTTHVDNLFLCGTDQGFVGIIGAIISGISIANQHILQKA